MDSSFHCGALNVV